MTGPPLAGSLQTRLLYVYTRLLSNRFHVMRLFMFENSTSIVQRLWNYCNVLRDDGVSYGDYVEQLTYLLFLKLADEG